jgi:hypothetical protein
VSILDHLSAAAGVYWGEGAGEHVEDFVARVALVAHDGGEVTFEYEAWSAASGLQHAESARMGRRGGDVVLATTSNGGDDAMTFREGEPGVFGSLGPNRVGLVISTRDRDLSFSWWWPDAHGRLREQSRAVVAPSRQLVAAPPPISPAPTVSSSVEPPKGAHAHPQPAARSSGEPAASVPWPGILVLHGTGTGVVAQRLAERLTRAAVVRTDLFDRAVRGTAGVPDPALRHRIAVSVVQGYASAGHPVILHGSSPREDDVSLVEAITAAGLSPVQLVDVADGEDYGEVARRLIDGS